LLRETTPSALVVVVRFPGCPWALVRALRAMASRAWRKIPVVGVGPEGLAVEAHALRDRTRNLAEPIEALGLCAPLES